MRLRLPVINSEFLLGIGVLAILLGRLWYSVTTGPVSLNQDEAAILLNARFIAESGQDEWGEGWPIVLRSFGDYKLPGYVYTVALVGKAIGFSDLAVRLPSFIAGLALFWLTWKISVTLFHSRAVGLVSLLLLAVSPWSWHYSSVGFEANLGLSLWLLSLWLFLSKQRLFQIFAAGVVMLASLLTYNSPLLLFPAAFGAVTLFDWGRWKRLALKLTALTISSVLAAGLTLTASLQKGGISVFSDPTLIDAYPTYRAGLDPMWQTLLGNKYVYFISHIWNNWWKHLSWQFLVERGGNNPWHTIPDTGHLHFMVPILLAFGLGACIWLWFRYLRQSSWSLWRNETVIILLFVWSLVPAAITADAPHATRSLFFFVIATLIAARGLIFVQARYCGSNLPKRWQDAFTYTIAGLVVLGFALWWFPTPQRWRERINPRWNTGLAEALNDSRIDSADKVYILDPAGLLYSVIATTRQSSVSEFLTTVRRSAPDVSGLVRVERYGRYEFVFQPSDARPPGVLLMPVSSVQWDIIEL